MKIFKGGREELLWSDVSSATHWAAELPVIGIWQLIITPFLRLAFESQDTDQQHGGGEGKRRLAATRTQLLSAGSRKLEASVRVCFYCFSFDPNSIRQRTAESFSPGLNLCITSHLFIDAICVHQHQCFQSFLGCDCSLNEGHLHLTSE